MYLLLAFLLNFVYIVFIVFEKSVLFLNLNGWSINISAEKARSKLSMEKEKNKSDILQSAFGGECVKTYHFLNNEDWVLKVEWCFYQELIKVSVFNFFYDRILPLF